MPANLPEQVNTTANVVEEIVDASSNTAFYHSEEFWVAIAFMLVVVGLFIPVSKKILSLLQNRINRIKKELQDAEDLKLEAQELYAKYERNLMHIDDEIARIISNQEDIIEETKQLKTKELNSLLNQKQKEVEAKINSSFNEAHKEIKEKISQKVSLILNNALKLSTKEKTNLIDKSIDNISKIDITTI